MSQKPINIRQPVQLVRKSSSSKSAKETTPKVLYDAGWRIFYVAGQWHAAQYNIKYITADSKKEVTAYARKRQNGA